MGKDYVKHMEMQVFVHGDLDPAFKVVDAAGFDGPLNHLKITNTMDQPVVISFDGVYDHEYIKESSSIDVMAQICNRGLNKKSLFKNKTKVYVRQIVNLPKGGALIVMGFYQE